MEGEMVQLVSDEDKDTTPIVAGAGFTKTMAPRGERDIVKHPLPIVNEDVKQFYENFVDAIEGKAEPVIKNDEVMQVMRIMEHAFESSRTGQAIHL